MYVLIPWINDSKTSFESLALKADLYQLFGALSGKNTRGKNIA